MIIDASSPNPAFAEGRIPDLDLDALIEVARAELKIPVVRPWRLVSARRKLGKTLFEVEEGLPGGSRRLIGIVSKSERVPHAFDALRRVWAAGMQPPASFTVVEPVLYLPERACMILEKAPGVLLWDAQKALAPALIDWTRLAGQWLSMLHNLQVDAPVWRDHQPRVQRWSRELADVAPQWDGRIRALAERALGMLQEERELELVPSHGDFHSGNLFISESRVTGIDLDKFARRDRAFDVAYYLAQTACMGYWEDGSFERTLGIRDCFLKSYCEHAHYTPSPERLAPYIATTLIQNLHFELRVYKTDRNHIIEPWLAAAERCLATLDVRLEVPRDLKA
jgi:aminoglycoside phosphotransferase